jgi:hypothetical protein
MRFIESNISIPRQRLYVIVVFIICFFIGIATSNKNFRPYRGGHANRSTLTSNVIFATCISIVLTGVVLTQKHIKRIELCDDKKELKIVYQRAIGKEKHSILKYKNLCYSYKMKKHGETYWIKIIDEKNFNFILSEFDKDTQIAIERQLIEIGARKIT